MRAGSNNRANRSASYQVADKKLEFVTSDKYESISPAFSGDGKWLYFLSSRNFTLGTVRPGATATWVRVRQARRRLRAGAAAWEPLPLQA